MKRLSKEAEERLLAAIEKTAGLVNAGEDPNSAIVKAAREDGVPPGQISLMVHAYNTGRTTRQREEGGSPLEKAAEFPLADTATVLEQLYPSKVKTAGEITRDRAVSLEYAVPPTGLLTRNARRQMLKQGASIDWRRWAHGDQEVTVTAPAPYPTDPATLLKRAYCEAERLQREVSEARRKQAAAMDKMAACFSEITEYFRCPGAVPIPVVREQAYLLHGTKAAQLVDEIVKVTPALGKMSQHRVKVSNYRLEPANGEVYGLISEFLDVLDEYKRCKQAHADVSARNAELVEGLLRPFAERPRSVLDELGFSTKRANMFGEALPMLYGASAIKNIMAGGPSGSGDSEANKALAQLTDPAHEATLRNIRAQAMLQDLLTSDPVVSTHDPQDVMDAYNEIVSMTPRAADQRLLVQPLLRKKLEQGQLDPFEVDQMLGMEEKQKKINTLGTGGGDGSVLS